MVAVDALRLLPTDPDLACERVDAADALRHALG